MKNQLSKFAIIFLTYYALLLMSCEKKDEITPEKKDETPPILSVPFVDVSKTVLFISFGEVLSKNQENPAYEIHVNSNDAIVFSASAGVIERISSNAEESPGYPSQDDFEIFVRPFKNSIYLIIYDHVRNLLPNIIVGAKLTPGDVLGNVGLMGNVGRIELQINKHLDNHQEISLCPKQFGTDAFNNAMEEARTRSIVVPSAVCLKETVIP